MAEFDPVSVTPRTKIALDSAVQNRDLGSLVIHQSADPYVVEWFNDLKETGDTPKKFLLRKIYAAALEHRRVKLTGLSNGPNPAVDPHGEPSLLTTLEDQRENYRHLLSEEQTTLAAAIELILP